MSSSSSNNYTTTLSDLIQELYPSLSSSSTNDKELSSVVSKLQTIIKANTANSNTESNNSSNNNRNLVTEKDAILISYPDHFYSNDDNEKDGKKMSPLSQLAKFAHQHLSDIISIIHILPFHPSVGYDGYSITDYDAVDEVKFGTWKDIQKEFRPKFSLMFDLVLNHCSSSHPRFQRAVLAQHPEDPDRSLRNEFAHLDDSMNNIKSSSLNNNNILRARDESCLFYDFGSDDSDSSFKNVWCTYHRELVDWSWSGSTSVMLYFIKNLLETFSGHQVPKEQEDLDGNNLHQQQQLFSAVRLDAYGYVWKELGTPCVNHPKLKVLLKLFRYCLSEAGYSSQRALILPSITNVTMSQCLDTCFGTFMNTMNKIHNDHQQGKHDDDHDDDDDLRGQLSYHLPLPALLLHALHSRTENVAVLYEWLSKSLPSLVSNQNNNSGILMNLSSTHDGIGLTWCREIFSETQRRNLINSLVDRGGIFKTRRAKQSSSNVNADDLPWEVCITTWSACSPDKNEQQQQHAKRFLAIQSIVVALKGIPVFYLGAILCGENAIDEVERIKNEYPNDMSKQTLHCAERAINRGRFKNEKKRQVEEDLLLQKNGGSQRSLVLNGLKHLMNARKSSPAFHPIDSTQHVWMNQTKEVLIIVRESSILLTTNSSSSSCHRFVICFINMSSNNQVFIDPVKDEIFTKCFTLEQRRKYVTHHHEGAYGGLFRDLLVDEDPLAIFDLRFGLCLEPLQYRFLAPVVTRRGDETTTTTAPKINFAKLEETTRQQQQQVSSTSSSSSSFYQRSLKQMDHWKSQNMLEVAQRTFEKEEHDQQQRINNSQDRHLFFNLSSSNPTSSSSSCSSSIPITIIQHDSPLHKSDDFKSSTTSSINNSKCMCFIIPPALDEATFVDFHVRQQHCSKEYNNNNNNNNNACCCPHTGRLSGIDGVCNPSYYDADYRNKTSSSPRDHVTSQNDKDKEEKLLIVCSPSCRSLQTALRVKGSQSSRSSSSSSSTTIVALEELRAMDNSHAHSKRLPLTLLKSIFDGESIIFENDDVVVTSDENQQDTHYDESISFSRDDDEPSNSLMTIETRTRMENRIRIAFDKIIHKFNQGKFDRVVLISHFSFLMTAICPGDDTKLHFARKTNNLTPIVDTSECSSLHETIDSPTLIGKQGFKVDAFLSRRRTNNGDDETLVKEKTSFEFCISEELIKSSKIKSRESSCS